ncbi:electron transport complex subunit RsxC [Oscillospiraceae bacterium CM]|nr:electron transport complex subunit RsxC [Oscillospiraceae bacterium CM]
MLKTFRGGVHPEEHKDITAELHTEFMPPPQKVIIPVSQHIGAPGVPMVNVGDTVKKGQPIASADVHLTAWVHASISGKVVEIAEYPSSFKDKSLAIVIESDGLDEWAPGLPMQRDFEKLSVEEIHKIVTTAGLVGLGGANFPSHFKLTYGPEKHIDTLLINAAECEPYLNSDYRVMIEETDRVVLGVKIAMKSLNVKRCFVGVEDNKPKAIEGFKKAFANVDGVTVVALPTKYPQGAERMFIKVLTEREIPAGKRHSDIGIVGLNVGSIVAIANAVEKGIPLIERVITVSGDAIAQPKNLRVRIGTSFKDIVEYCGGYSKTPKKIINGGPMMGYALSDLNIPVIKGVAGILVMSKDAVAEDEEYPCIRCGKCVDACPAGLVPSMLSILSERGRHTEAREEYGVFNCIECGSCAYVCPSKRRILQYIRYSKAKNAGHGHH